ncbi:hypothetical protein GCM10008957_22670 [Deinococcus ruber]|uniref:Uncharacterized protein n=1 Tax=Deinococcus ruber TaxID=1848197 RepID=A0A918F5D2_9DEIO|nr:hypothetical protein GCM10008957_22670 [Deinococcus ruber]
MVVLAGTAADDEAGNGEVSGVKVMATSGTAMASAPSGISRPSR